MKQRIRIPRRRVVGISMPIKLVNMRTSAKLECGHVATYLSTRCPKTIACRACQREGSEMKKLYRLSIDQCPVHDYRSVSIGDGDTGKRVTPSKCCGRWSELKSWALTAAEWHEVAKLARCAERRAAQFERSIGRKDSWKVARTEKI